MAANNGSNNPEQPRQPRNLQGLLKFAMEATKAEDAPGNALHGPMDEERRKFLEEAMASLTIDMSEVIKNSIEVLTNTDRMRSIQLGESMPQDVKKAFEVLLEVVDNIDIAKDYYKIGGYAVFPICYGSENEEVRKYASSLLAELCQNNPFCQEKALECGFLTVLLTLAQTERGDALTKCVYALSCCSREFEPACRELITQGGCETLAQLLSAPEPAVRTKSAFLIRYLCQHYNEAKEQIIKHNIVSTVAKQLLKERDQSTEHVLNVLVVLIQDLNPQVIKQFRDPTIGLKKVIEDFLKQPDLQDDTYIEEKEYCQEILNRVFENYAGDDYVEDLADR